MYNLSEFLALMMYARPAMAQFFADPPEGLCSGHQFHARVLALVDRAISEGPDCPQDIRDRAWFEVDRWMGKISADATPGEQEDPHAAWWARASAFPVRRYL